MALKPMKDSGIFHKIGKAFFTLKRSLDDCINRTFKSPFSWRSIFWDGYINDEFPDHLMRFVRFFLGLAFVVKFVHAALLGLFLVIDGIYSVYRHRYELALTKNWREDMPRIARSVFGFMLMSGIF